MRFAVGVVLAFALYGPCAAENAKVEVPPPVVVPPLDPGAEVQPVSFSRMAGNLADGQIIAEVGGCWFGASEPLRWRSSMNQFSDSDFETIFRDEFAKAGLKVAGDKTNLFEQDAKRSDLQIGALLTDIRVRACYGANVANIDGSGVVRIEWQVYSVSAGKVIARVPAVAGVSDQRSSAVGDLLVKIVQKSFAEDVRVLAADPGFRKIVLDRNSAAAVSAAPAGPLTVAFPSTAKAIALKDAAAGAVVVFAGGGMGSGVLISADGYILTNHHVAGEAGRVRIRWSDGGESVGQVVRSDKRRDVALIKVDAPKGRPLFIRRTPVELGETVYAIGTPLGDDLQNTLTRGIVSGVRTMDGERFIQSDTPVTHGNSGGPLLDERGAVVGLSDLGLDPSLGSSINFFIPIGDAVKALALRPAS